MTFCMQPAPIKKIDSPVAAVVTAAEEGLYVMAVPVFHNSKIGTYTVASPQDVTAIDARSIAFGKSTEIRSKIHSNPNGMGAGFVAFFVAFALIADCGKNRAIVTAEMAWPASEAAAQPEAPSTIRIPIADIQDALSTIESKRLESAFFGY